MKVFLFNAWRHLVDLCFISNSFFSVANSVTYVHSVNTLLRNLEHKIRKYCLFCLFAFYNAISRQTIKTNAKIQMLRGRKASWCVQIKLKWIQKTNHFFCRGLIRCVTLCCKEFEKASNKKISEQFL